MAKQTWNNPIDKSVDWGGDETTGYAPVSGEMVQRFIKETFNQKAGIFYYDNANNRYLVFADAEARDAFLLDPTQTGLIIGTFDAPFNYTAEINLTSAAYNAVFLGSTGNYIDFTFDVKNKQGASTGENVTVTYTFIRNAIRQTVTETRKFGDVVHFNVDKYIGEGTNTIMVGITGQTSLAATTVAITYQVVNLTIEDGLDISKSYNLSGGSQRLEVPFTVSGYGTKVVEWYLDGELLPFIKAEDEVVDVIATRTKYITLANLQQGTHSLQIRAYTVVNGEKFYTDTLYRDIIVYTGANSDVIIGVAVTIPRLYGVLGANDAVAIYDMVQYVPYVLRFATYSPSNAANTNVTISIDGVSKGTIGSVNAVENEFILTSKTSGNKVLKLSTEKVSKEIAITVKETDMNIQEITNGLVLDFSANGKSNNSSDRDSWFYGDYVGTLSGFNWNNSSGWVNGRLEMNAGSSFGINIAPLSGNPTNTGKTIEIEWSTKNVTNDDAIICDLRNESGVGILITATKVSMTSADGVVVETEYKSDENVRVGFVINQASGTTNKRLSFIYANGIVSRAEQWAETDNYISDKLLSFSATNEVEVSLKAIRIYDVALSSDNMLNNYILYRDTIAEMMEVYDRNDVYEEGTVAFSPEKMMGRLPVMIVTGDIPTLENTSDKNEQIVVDIEYYNMQDPTKSFTMKHAAMRPQGTSSMGYPKKNFRIYTEKVANTELYDANGKLVENKLYSFKEGAQPVNCWCLKADYAESSGTHNTGIARLWNEALFNAQIDEEYKLRTEAQKKAVEAGYEYDVRTTIDGFPILLFYRPSANDDLIFIGKYNFNNDKSTESVFGFTGIPNFNNEKMQCWEVLNNGNALALFTTVDGFDEGWSEAFESRYPDTKTPYTGDLKAFCQWMTTVTQEEFATEKWEHLNVYMMAAYWVYLMRHAAADQFVKNAMFTSEDGQHFYYILYDNDTINGLINTGRLRIKPTDDRQTVDETGSYVFAGHDSRLWNMLEADEEFKNIVSSVDNALYTAGISYANTIRIFDEEQADKWVEKVYNQDAQYKYVGPYVEKGINNLFMLQGKRDLHRRWWLAKRFSIYDAKYVSGSYKSQAIEIKCLNGTQAGQEFSIVAGYPIDYGYGINNVPREFGVSLNIGESHTFKTKEVVNLGDPVRIYGAPNLAEVDFSPMSDRLAVVTIANVYDENLGTKLTKLTLGNANKSNAEVTEISGLKQAEALEELDVQGMTKINSLDLSNQKYFRTLWAFGSGISSVSFAKGAPVERLELPSSMRVLSLNQLPYLDNDDIVFENIANLQQINVTACPNVTDDFSFVYNWYSNKLSDNKTCSLVMDGVVWEDVDSTQFLNLCNLKLDGGEFNLKGKVSIPNATLAVVRTVKAIFGETAFLPTAELYIEIPTILETSADKYSILEGEKLQFTHELYPSMEGTFTYSLTQGRTGCSINPTTGLLTTTEKAIDTSNVVVRVTFKSTDGKTNIYNEKTVQVVRRSYPENIDIVGDGNLIDNYNFTLTWNNNPTGDFVTEWSLEGAITQCYAIVDSSNTECSLQMDIDPNDTIEGKLIARIKRKFDNVVVASKEIRIYHEIFWPTNATIEGDTNPINDSAYVYKTTDDPHELTGNYVFEWSLSGDILSYFEVSGGDTNMVRLLMIEPPITTINGTLTLTLKKAYNGATIITATKPLAALIPDVVINYKDNAPIQAALYDAGLVANEKYSLKSEVEAITAAQLQTGSAATTSIFYSQRNNITSFDEFRYFTGVTNILQRTFQDCTVMTSIKMPNTVTEVANYVFQNCSALVDIELSTSLKKVNSSTFANCVNLKEVVFPEGFTTTGSNTFINCPSLRRIYFPTSTTTIGGNVFMSCGNLNIEVAEDNPNFTAVDGVLFNKAKTKLIEYAKDKLQPEYEVPHGVTNVGNYAFYNRQHMTSITFPSTLTRLGNDVISMCPNLSSLTFNCVNAPSTDNASVFGATNNAYTGRNTYSSGTNRLRIPLNATGYETGLFLDPLQNASKCGFSIHGKLTLASNRSDAQFDVKYTTEANTSKTVTVGVGTCYLNDIKYGTSLTATPKASGSLIFDSASTTITYNGATTITNNAYVYPSSVTINGVTTLQGGNTSTFTATIAPSNVDVDVTYTWSISGSSNATISSTSGNQCTVNTTTPEAEENFTLTCVAKSTNGKVTVQDTHSVKLMPRQNFITATYKVTSTTSATKLVLASKASVITYMEVDGVEVTPSATYIFPSTGNHTVRFTVKDLALLFQNSTKGDIPLVSLDFNECDGSKYTSMLQFAHNCTSLTSVSFGECSFPNMTSATNAFNGCSSLQSINFGNCSFPNVNKTESFFSDCTSLTNIIWGNCYFPKTTSLKYFFRRCSSLKSIDLSRFSGAPITTMYYAFSDCSVLTSIDLSPLNEAPITTFENAFYNCKALTSIEWGNCKFSSVTNMTAVFGYCSSLTSINLTPFEGAPISKLDSTFYGCSSLTSIDLSPLSEAAITYLDSTFGNCSALTSIDLSPLAGAPIAGLERTFYNCSVLASIDLSPLEGAPIMNLYSTFYGCKALTSIEWGECTFPNVTTLYSTFYGCKALTSIDLSPLAGAPITTLASAFYDCSTLASIDLSPLAGAPITNLYSTFYGCKALTSIDLSPLAGAPITTLSSAFYGCNALTSIDLSPLAGAPITNLKNTLNGCAALKTIIAPWTTAPTVESNTFGTTTGNYTGRNTYNTGQNMLIIPTGATGYDSSYWGSILLDSTKCGFKIIQNGVYIQHINGALYTESEWTSKSFANTEANGVALLSDECSFVIAKSDSGTSTTANLAWGGSGTLVSGIVTSTTTATALLDFDGRGNTPKIIEQLEGINDGTSTGAPSAEYCSSYIFPNGKNGYLPAMGELLCFYNNKTAVASAMSTIGGAPIADNYLSSTQYSDAYCWRRKFSSSYNGHTMKTSKAYSTRAFTTLF